MSENRIDQRFDNFVDKLVVRVPAFFRYLGIRIARNPFGWHLCLLITSIKNAIGGLLVHFRSETDMDVFMDDTSEQLGAAFGSVRQFLSGQFNWMDALDAAGSGLRFYTQLFFIALSVCGCVFTASGEMAAIAAMVMLSWIATAYDLSYRPVMLKLRQVYVAARMISAFAMLVPTLRFYISYRSRGVSNNMLLQGMMVFILLTHIIIFAIMIAPNRRQKLFLRFLSGVLGILPSLLVASAVSYSATQMGTGFDGMITGIHRISGAVMLFLYDRLDALVSLGAVRLPYGASLLWLLNTFGILYLMIPAWT